MKRLVPLLLFALVAGACGTSEDGQFGQDAVTHAQDVATRIDRDALRASVEGIVNARVTEAPVVSNYNIQQPLVHINSLKFVSDAFVALGYTPVVEPFGSDDLAGSNVYVDVPGDTAEIVLVSGHHDAWFQSGADDNASALAVLIEAARVFKGQRLHRTIRIIAFDHEEDTMLGSGAYVDTHGQEQMRALVNMDCVGYASHEKGSQSVPTGFPLPRDTGDFIGLFANSAAHADAVRVARLASQMPAPVEAFGLLTPDDSVYPAVGAFRRSDQQRFWARGLPALFVSDTGNFRNPNYHTPNDQPETLDYDFLYRVAQLVVGSVAAFATD